MVKVGTVALKMKFLGGVYIGQDLCYVKIDIGENAITVRRVRAGQVVHDVMFDDPDRVIYLKTKLRLYWAKVRLQGRWRLTKTRYGAVMVMYYPSVSWGGNGGECHLWNDGSF